MIGNLVKFQINSGRILIVAILVLGVFFRFVNLDKKVYWGDEVYTSFRIAGYTLTEVSQELFEGSIKSIQELQVYQQPNPERGIIYTIQSLAIEDSQHPPLYYIIARFWEQYFGSELANRRSLPAVISLLVFPGIYYLSLELFGSIAVSWIAVAIVAISPFHVLYAQEVREYSLWTATIIISSWLLLRSLRLNSKSSWMIYAVSLSILLYTYLFSILILIGHAIYVFLVQKWQFTNRIVCFIIASGFGILTFAPWLSIVLNNTSKINETTNLLQAKVSLTNLIQMWGINISRAFIDLDSQGRLVPFNNAIPLIVIIPVTILVGYAIYYLSHHADRTSQSFIITLIVITALASIGPDLILGGIRSSATRYLIPSYIGIQLAVAYLLGKQIANHKHTKLWQSIAIVIITSGIISCAINSQAQSWWNKYGSYYNPQIAQIINQTKQPLAIGNAYIPRILSLSYLLHPKVKIQFLTEAKISQIPKSYSNIFLYRPSPQLQTRLKKQLNYKIETVYQSPPLYQYLKPISQQSEIWLSQLKKPHENSLPAS